MRHSYDFNNDNDDDKETKDKEEDKVAVVVAAHGNDDIDAMMDQVVVYGHLGSDKPNETRIRLQGEGRLKRGWWWWW